MHLHIYIITVNVCADLIVNGPKKNPNPIGVEGLCPMKNAQPLISSNSHSTTLKLALKGQKGRRAGFGQSETLFIQQ